MKHSLLTPVISSLLFLAPHFAAAQTAADITDLILVTGQSNVTGSQSAYDPSLDQVDLRVFAYTDTNDWEVADLHQAWDADGWHPGNGSLADTSRTPYNNFAFHFAKTVVKNDPDRVVGVIIASAPGEGIAHWDANSPFSQTVESKVLAALSAQGVKSQIDGILWHQGETDHQFNGTSDVDATDAQRADPTYYPDKLDALIKRYRTSNWFSSNKPFICGETKLAPVNGRLTALNDDGDSSTGCIIGNDLTTRDGVHFDASGLRLLGQRYAQKYLQMSAAPSSPSPKAGGVGTVRIMAVGDSITEGFTPAINGVATGTPSYRQEFTNLLSTGGCDFEMVGSKSTNYRGNNPQNIFSGNHEGYSGQRANHVRDSYNWDAANDQPLSGVGSEFNPGITEMMQINNPDAVLLHIGTNDLRGGNTVNSTANEIGDIIQQIHAENSDTIVFIANMIPHYPNTPQNSNVNQSTIQLGNAIESTYGNNAVTNVHVVDVSSGYTANYMQTDQIHPNSAGEAHIADAFASVYSTVFSCNGQSVDLIAPETFINSPTANKAVDSTHTFSGTATDTGGSGLNRVQVAIKDTDTGDWYNFVTNDGSFGPISQGGNDIGITDASLTTALPTNSSGWEISRTLPAGNYQFYALAVDEVDNDAFHGSGLNEWPVNRVFSVMATDATKPTAQTTNPADGATITAGTINISGTASDNDSGVSRVRVRVQRLGTSPALYWDGTTWAASNRYNEANISSNGSSWTLPNVDYTISGSYRIQLRVIDNAGNVSTVNENPTNNFTVGELDNTPPSAQTTSPNEGSTLFPSTAEVTGTFSDDLSGVARVRVRLQRLDTSPQQFWNGSTWSNLVSYAEANVSPNDSTWTLPDVDFTNPGSYRVRLRVIDNAGNSSGLNDNPRSDFSVGLADNTAPNAEAISPATGSSLLQSTADVTGTTSDDISGVARVRVRLQRLDTSPQQFWTGSAWSTSNSYADANINSDGTAWTLPNVDFTNSGSYRIRLRVIDNAGNSSGLNDNPINNFIVQ